MADNPALVQQIIALEGELSGLEAKNVGAKKLK